MSLNDDILNSVTNLQVDEYLSSLYNIATGTDEYTTLNSLLLLSPSIYQETVKLLACNLITLKDLQKLKVINDDTVFSFLYNVKHNTETAVEHRNYFIKQLDETLRINEKIKDPLMKTYQLYLKKYFTGLNNFTVPIDVGVLGYFKNFKVAASVYNNAISHPKDNSGEFILSEPLKNKFLNDLLEDLKVKTSELSFEFNLFLDLAIEFTDYPILLATIYNPKDISKYPSAIFLFKEIYKYTSPKNYNNIYQELLNDMVDNYDKSDLDTVKGITTIKKFYNDYTIEKLNNSDLRYDITSDFMHYKLLRYDYPKMFNEQFEFMPKDELVFNKNEIDEFIQYCEVAKNYFLELLKVTKEVFNNYYGN